MVLYLTSQAHMDLLDCYSQGKDAKPVKRMVGTFNLKQFVVHDMRNFSHCSELVLDRMAFGDSDSEFVEAIEEFRTMYQARITVIAIGLTEDDGLLHELLNAGIGNVVRESEAEEFQDEIRLCLSSSGLGKYHIREREETYCEGEKYTFLCGRVQIAVIGSQHRIGATTVALGLANWINMAGGTACYVEANESSHMERIAADYGMGVDGRGYILDGVGYYKGQPGKDYQFIVKDFGTNIPKKVQEMVVLVCGTKPYELHNTARLLQYYEGQELVILLPFVAQGLWETYMKLFLTDNHKVLFFDYQPDCLDGFPNAGKYKSIIKKYISEG